MKKFCTLFFAVACCSIVFGQIISVTDGTLADWDNVPSEYLFKTECAPNASMDGLKSVQVYVDMTYINLLVEVNDEVVTNREWTPFHVFINSDNNAATGGYGDQWTDADTDLMLETAIFGDGMVIPYNPAVFKWWGPNGENGWQWTDPEVEGTAENGWGALVPEGSMPIGNAQMVDGKIEIQLDYTFIPIPFDETTFTLGFDIQQSWSSVGVLPNAADDEFGLEVLAEKLRVYVHPQNSSMRPTIDGVQYKITSNAEPYTAEVLSSRNLDTNITEITIPETIVVDGITYSVTSIGNGVFYGCSSLTSVTIPNSVTTIGNYAFSDCSSLTSIIIPNSVTSIGERAFSYCSSLTSVTIGNSVTSIGYSAFSSCSSLTSIILKGSTIESFCQSTTNKQLYNADVTCYRKIELNNQEINDLIIPNSVTSIEDYAFWRCTSLTSITIPNSVTSIGERAFSYCSSLTSVTIGNSVTSIGYQAFYNCSSLTSITIPNSVTSVGDYAFSRCSSLDTIYVEATTPPTIESNTFTNTPAPICYIPCGTKAAYEASDWAQYMGEFVEEGCVDSTMIITYTSTDGNIVTPYYNPEAFGANIVSNTYENGIGTITFDGPVTSIGNSAFTGCTSLTSLTIPNSVTSIGNSAFTGCTSLTSLIIPESVTSIGNGAFSRCPSLTSITIPNSVTSIRDYTFQSCSSLCSITIPNSITSIGRYTFSYCSSLTSIAIPNSVTSIGDSAFRSCTSLTSITIPNSVTSIGNSAFLDCSSMVKTYFTGDITDWCKIEFVNVSANPINNSHNLYLNDVEVKDLIIPEGVTSVGNCAFYSCSSLTSVTIPNSVTSIGAVAFMKCSSLTFVAIGDGVTTIGDNAFFNCSSLDTLYIEATTPPTIGNNLFYTPAPTCYIPCGTKATYETSDWAQYMSEFVEECEVDSTMIITYTSTDGNIVTPYNAEAFGANIVSNTYENGAGTITFDGPVTSIGNSAFTGCDVLRSINIPNSVTSIGNSAFEACSSLTSITIPNSVTSIGDYAFSSCSSLTSVTIPNSVTSIGSWAFRNCSSLTSMVVEEGNTTYDSRDNCNAIIETATNTLFIGCGNSTIPNSVTSIGYGAFEACSSLTSITIPNSITSIGRYTFSYCYSLSSITIPNSVTSIGERAFSDCDRLSTVFLQTATLPHIGDDIFADCVALSCVIPCGTLATYKASDWADQVSRFVEDCEEVYTMNYTSSDGNIVVPYDSTAFGAKIISNTYENGIGTITFETPVTSIGYYAFRYCTSLTSITIPNSVTSIRSEAFSYCSSLSSVTIPNSVTSIGYEAFLDCDALTSIVVEDGNTTYDSRDNCNAIIETATNTLIAGCQNTIIPNSVTSIGYSAFFSCSSLTSITIPNSVTSIGNSAFFDCSYLTSIVIPASVTNIGTDVFNQCNYLDTMIVEDGNTTYDSRDSCNAIIETATNTLIAGCGNTTIPNSVTSIGDWAFQHCFSLQSITIPESVTSIGDGAFWQCGLTSITIGNSVTSIKDRAFAYCSSLDTIYLEATTPPTIESNTFTNTPAPICYIPCGTKAAYEVSDWAQYMGEFVEDCDNKCGNQLYWEYNDPQLSITGYGDMYDYDIEPQPWQQHRNKITQISLPEGMTSVGAAAFADCKYVTSVAIPATVEKIHDSAFEDCRMLSSLSFAEPSALTSIGNWAFYNCHKLQYITIPEGVTEIGEAAFFDCTYLSELTLPATMEYIADNGFGLCAKLKRINVSATTPPAVEARTFEDVDRSIPVYVPDAAVNDYKAAPVWQEFNIVGKEGVSTSMDNLNTSTYGIQKLLRDGNLVIIRDGVEYNVMGQQL